MPTNVHTTASISLMINVGNVQLTSWRKRPKCCLPTMIWRHRSRSQIVMCPRPVAVANSPQLAAVDTHATRSSVPAHTLAGCVPSVTAAGMFSVCSPLMNGHCIAWRSCSDLGTHRQEDTQAGGHTGRGTCVVCVWCVSVHACCGCVCVCGDGGVYVHACCACVWRGECAVRRVHVC